MVNATWEFHVDWDNNGTFDAGNEDITARVLQAEWTLGRDYASMLTGKVARNSCILTLNNESGDYSSHNTGSPIAGDILPGRDIRIRATDASGTEIMWVGKLERLTPQPAVNGINIAILEAVTPLTFVAADKVRMAMKTNILTGTLQGDLLDNAGWPAGDRVLDTGLTTIPRIALDEQGLLNALHEGEETENGFIYDDRQGRIVFEDRHHRLKSPHLTSQATFSDAPAASLVYGDIEQQDSLDQIFNIFPLIVQLYTVGGAAVLWTLSESGAASPAISPGQSLVFFARYPNPASANNAFAVDAWTNLVENTDYEANTQAGGGGTDISADLAVVEDKFANAMKITITHNGALAGFITLLQAQGTPVTSDDPIPLEAEDLTSQGDHGERVYRTPAKWIGSSAEGRDHNGWLLSQFKDNNPILTLPIVPNRDAAHLSEALRRTISDRVTVVANNNAGLGINEDFFIEAERHTLVNRLDYHVAWALSNATKLSDFWVWGTAKWGTTTKWAY